MGNTSCARYSIEESQNLFRERLRTLVPDAETKKSLASALGVTTTAIELYLSDTDKAVYPKTANLIKIAEYFDKSLDYIVGISDIETPDATIRGCCEYTGLKEAAIKNIKKCDSPLLTRILESPRFFDLLDDLDHLAFLVDLLKEDTEETSKSVPAGNLQENIDSLLRENGFSDGVVTGNRPFRYPFEWRALVSDLSDVMNKTRVQRFELIEAFPALIEELIPCHAVLADAKKTLKEHGEVFSRSAEMKYKEDSEE